MVNFVFPFDTRLLFTNANFFLLLAQPPFYSTNLANNHPFLDYRPRGRLPTTCRSRSWSGSPWSPSTAARRRRAARSQGSASGWAGETSKRSRPPTPERPSRSISRSIKALVTLEQSGERRCARALVRSKIVMAKKEQRRQNKNCPEIMKSKWRNWMKEKGRLDRDFCRLMCGAEQRWECVSCSSKYSSRIIYIELLQKILLMNNDFQVFLHSDQ